MSKTTLYKIPNDGTPIKTAAVYSNQYYFAPLIWEKMAGSFLGWSRDRFYNALGTADALWDVWRLHKNPTVDRRLRMVLIATFDRAVFERSDLAALADALDYFVDQYLLEEGEPKYSLRAMAADIRKLADDESVWGACWQASSTAADLWHFSEDRQVGLGEILGASLDICLFGSDDMPRR